MEGSNHTKQQWQRKMKLMTDKYRKHISSINETMNTELPPALKTQAMQAAKEKQLRNEILKRSEKKSFSQTSLLHNRNAKVVR